MIERLGNVFGAASLGVEWRAIAIAAITMIVAILVPRISNKLPAFLFALVAGTLAGVTIGAENMATIGALPSVLPSFSPALPTLDQASILAESALAIALIGLLEAVAIGRSFAGRTGVPFSANQEVIGQGLSNVVGSMFQAYPGSGSFTRSGLNYESGAKTPLSAVFASLALIGILFAVSPLVAYIPIASMSGLIIIVAVRLINVKEISHIIRTSKSETMTLTATFAIGILVELELAIFVGVILSLGTFILRTMQPKFAVGAPDPSLSQRTFRNAEVFRLPECPQMMVCRFDGPLYFGSSEMLEAEFRRIASERPQQKLIVVNLKGVGDIDLSGVDTIIKEADRRRSTGGDLYVIARAVHFVTRLKRLGLYEALGEDHVFTDKFAAISTIVPTLDQPTCNACTKKIFRECPD